MAASFRSEPVDLGTFTADAQGVLSATITVPDVGAGVHSVVFEGEGADGVALEHRLMVDVPGRPVDSYSTYLCCFGSEPEALDHDAAEERVDVTVDGVDWGTYTPDEHGGLLVTLPVIDRLADPSPLLISATSRLTDRPSRSPSTRYRPPLRSGPPPATPTRSG